MLMSREYRCHEVTHASQLQMHTGDPLLVPLWGVDNTQIWSLVLDFLFFFCNTLPHITVTHFHMIRFTTADHSWQVTRDIFKPCAPPHTLISRWSARCCRPYGRHSLSHVCADVLKYTLTCKDRAARRLWAISSHHQDAKSNLQLRLRLQQKQLCAFSSMRKHIFPLSELPSSVFYTCGNSFFCPPCCSDIAPVFRLCAVVCHPSAALPRLFMARRYLCSLALTDSALYSWLSSLSARWSP